MAIISIIAAVGENNELGYNNNLLWHLKKDLAHFKEITMNKKVIMGSNTYKSLPKKLEGRTYIILSSKLTNIEDAMIFNNFNDLLNYLNTIDEEVMIIGGASIYKLFIPYADKLYLTEIKAAKEADVYFPDFDKTKYKKEVLESINEDNIEYDFCLYQRVRDDGE